MKTIKHTNTLVYHDGVQVFAGEDAVGDHYVGAMIDAVGDSDRYLVVAASPDLLRRFYVGELDLRTLLLDSSINGWYTALVGDDFDHAVSLEAQQGSLIEMDYLPESGFRLTTAPAIDRSSASLTETGSTNVDALDRLAFGLYQANGDYAVLLGSGISRAAEIPTGWEIAINLITQIAKLRGEDPQDDPVGWYERQFGRSVNYSDLVESLARTPAERSRLLSRYIDPDAEDIREGRKQPTMAHKAIAKLVKHGCINLIITTNIDSLMELALAAEQIHPVIVSSPDDLLGTFPLSRSRGECRVIKLHGDYKDIRSLNTASELKRYPESVDRLLDQILAEYGMIVCGWSAQWDVALCDAVRRSDSNTFSWFWAEHGVTSEAADELIAHRRAERIRIDDADSFFHGVLRKVDSLLGIGPQDPHPVEQGVAVLQRYLHQHLGLGGSDLRGDLSAVVSQLFALSDPTRSELHESEDSSELSRQIDFARELVGRGLVVQARNELERIRTAADQIPENLRARIATNLAACAMAEEDMHSAVYWSDEAYRLQPDNPAIVANAAMAAHRANDTGRALELAHTARELNPLDSPATSVIMIEMWSAGQHEVLDEFVASEDWVTQDAQCALVLASVRLLQSRFEEAVSLCRGRVAADGQDACARLALSQSLMKLAQASHPSPTYTETTVEQLEEVVAEVTQAIDLLRPTDLKLQRHSALILRGCARAILGLHDEAMADFDEVLRERPDSSEAIFYKALLYLDGNKPEEAVAWFKRVEDVSQLPDPVVPFALSLLSSGDASAAVGMLRDSFDLKSPGWEDIHRAELLLRAESLANEDNTVPPALASALQQAPTDPKLLALDAVVQDARGVSDEAEGALLQALEYVDAKERPEILMRLGNHYNDCGQFSEAADRFREVVGENPFHPLAIPLLVCLNNSKQLREALTLSKAIQQFGRKTPRVVADIELNILQMVGDASAAVSQCERICNHLEATPVDRVNLASAQVRLGDYNAAARTVLEIDRSTLVDYPVSLLQLAQIKRMLGVDNYIEDAYTARRHGFDNAEVHLGYFSTVVSRDHDFVEPESVGPGCAVLLRRETEEQWWSIVDQGETPVGPHELVPDDDLAVALAGRRAGETVVLRHGFENLQYEVMAIQSKFVRAFQETAAEFSTRFPNNMEMSRVTVDEDDPSKFLQVVDQRDKFVREVEQLYSEGVLPLVAFASLVGKFPMEVWRACTQYGFTRIAFGVGNDEETDQATTFLTDANAIVLDMVALFTIYELGIIDFLRERFNRVALPQLVFDDLLNLAFHSRTMGRKAGFIGKTDDGRYTMSDVPDDGWSQWQEQVESILAFASTLERIPSYGLLEVSNVEQLLSTLTPAGAGAVCAGDENSEKRPLLVSDDLALARIADALGTNAVNTQALLVERHRSSALSDADYSNLIERLVAMNYWFVRVRSEDIISSFEAHGYVTADGTRAMLRTLQGPDCLEDAAVIVAVNVVVELSSRTVPGQLELILALMLSTLQRGRETSPVLLKFRQAIENEPRLSALDHQRILHSISAYRIGGMTRSGSGLIVLR